MAGAKRRESLGGSLSGGFRSDWAEVVASITLVALLVHLGRTQNPTSALITGVA